MWQDGKARSVNNVYVTRIQSSGDSRFLQSLQQSFIQLFVGFYLSAQDVVLDRILRQLVSHYLLFFQGR
jgi:hypothetical protein